MEKVNRDGKVAVLISPDFGAGWSTWNRGETAKIMLFHPKIVEMVEQKRQEELNDLWRMYQFANCDINKILGL